MGVQEAPAFVDDSHLCMAPTRPDNVKVPVFEPLHTVVAPATVPPTDKGFTVNVAAAEFAVEQVPFFTTALYKLVVVMFI